MQTLLKDYPFQLHYRALQHQLRDYLDNGAAQSLGVKDIQIETKSSKELSNLFVKYSMVGQTTTD